MANQDPLFYPDWYQQVYEDTLWLVRTQSVVNTPGEAALARLIHGHLAAWPYFRAHPDRLWLHRTVNDTRERYSVMALVGGHQAAAGAGEAAAPAHTVILMGHFDTVGIEDFGALQPWACDPPELTPRLLAELQERDPRHPAVTDLASGRWLAGRGTVDMKSGVASHLAVARRYAAAVENGEPWTAGGAVLLLMTPDEEDMSHGILSALTMLPELTERFGLHCVAAINSDTTSPRYAGDPARYVYLGTIGKLLPCFYIPGRETHVGQPFEGWDPNLLAAELTRRIDYATGLADAALDEVAPPPVSLKQADLKEGYNVQTPLAACCYYNYLFMERTVRDVLQLFRSEAEAAFGAVADRLRAESVRWAQRAGHPPRPADWPWQVLTYADLYAAACQHSGPAAVATAVSDAMAALRPDPAAADLRYFSRRMIEAVWPLSGITPPAAVLFLASAYSPPVRLTGPDEWQQRLLAATRDATAQVAQETGLDLQLRHFYPYISDMSFLGGNDHPEDLEALAANMPAWGSLYRVNHSYYAGLGIPVVNIGPYGLDPHKRTERVETAYSFGVVPELTWRLVQRLAR